MLEPLLHILPAPQAKLWPELVRVPPHFVLYGGTAIALRLGHRQSVDFDYFSDVPLDDAGKQSILEMFTVGDIFQNGNNTLTFTAMVDGYPVKMSFFGGMNSGCITLPEMTNDGVTCIASLDDLFAHKLKVIHDRAEGKDYQDIAVMLMSGQSLAKGLSARKALFGTDVPIIETIKALTFFDDINETERLTNEMKRIIVTAVQHLPNTWDEIPVLSKSLAYGRPPAGSGHVM